MHQLGLELSLRNVGVVFNRYYQLLISAWLYVAGRLHFEEQSKMGNLRARFASEFYELVVQCNRTSSKTMWIKELKSNIDWLWFTIVGPSK